MKTCCKWWLAAMVMSGLTQPALAQDWRAMTGREVIVDEFDPNTAVFTRGGVGYSGGPNGLRTYGRDEMRRKWEVSCSQGKAEVLFGELVMPGTGIRYDAIPWCVNGQGLWANRTSTPELWLSPDGSSWTRKGPVSGLGWLGSLFALRDGRLIAFGTNGPKWLIARSDDGVHWAAGATSQPMTGAPYYIHNFCEAPHGTIIAVTYLGMSNGGFKQIWRSGDRGQTWELRWNGGVNQFTHFHSVAYHGGTGTWVADTGDAGANGHTFISKDDGRTWYEWYQKGRGANHWSPTDQVTCFRDGKDPRRVYFGSDGILRVGWLDLTTWRVGTSMERQFTNRYVSAQVWDLSQVDGIWYATLASAANGHETPMVLVSSDLNRWAVYARMYNTPYQTFGYCAGAVGGWLHYIAADDNWSLHHARVSLASVADVCGVCVSPAKTNMLTIQQSTCDQMNVGWVAAYNPDLFEVDRDRCFTGTGSLHIKKTNMSSGTVATIRLSPGYPSLSSAYYRFHVWVRGNAKELLVSADGVHRAGFGLRGDPQDGSPVWTEIWTPAVSGNGSSSGLSPRIDIYPNEVDGTAELWLGAAELAQAPAEGEWTPGGASSAMETFNYEGLTFPKQWTHLSSTVLLSGTDDMGTSGHAYIRTYRDAANYAELYFDCADDRFKLSLNGVVLIASAPRALLGGTRVYFAVRQYLTGELSLSISDGDGVEHLSETTFGISAPPLVGPDSSIRSGNNNGDQVAAQVYLEDVFIRDYVLSDEQVETAFSRAQLKGYNPIP